MDIRLIVLDVDGVLTDGTKVYNLEGNCVYKKFNDRDFTAIKRFVAAGIPVVFLSGDKNVNAEIAKKRNIPFYCSFTEKGLDKVSFLSKIRKEYHIPNNNQICYVGDDLFDLPIIKKIGLSCCPIDAIHEIKLECKWILPIKGGEGVVAELYRNFQLKGWITDASIEDLVIIDRKEFRI